MYPPLPTDVGVVSAFSDAQAAADVVVRDFAARLRLSVGQQARLAVVRERLIAARVHPAGPAYARYLSPLVCATPEEQDEFLARFAEMAASLPSDSLAGPDGAAGLDAAGAPIERKPSPKWRSPALLTLGAGLLLTVLIVLTIMSAQPDPAPPPNNGGTGSSKPGEPSSWRVERDGWALGTGLTPWALLGFAPLAGFGLIGVVGLIIVVRRTKVFRPQPDEARDAILPVALEDRFTDGGSNRAIVELGRYARGAGRRLHVRRSLHATLRNGGFPTLRFGDRARAPDYIALVERQSRRDHLPLIADALARRFRRQGLALHGFAFRDDPAWLRPLDDPNGVDRPLVEVEASLPDARWLIFSESEVLFEAPARPAPWLRSLADTTRVAVVNPRRQIDWQDDERSLRQVGVVVLPAAATAMRAYADWMLTGAPPSEQAPPAGRRKTDLPFHLAGRRATLLRGDLTDEDFEGLALDLRVWLGDDGMRLFRALAVYPRLEPALTLALGRRLRSVVRRSAREEAPDGSGEPWRGRRIWTRVLSLGGPSTDIGEPVLDDDLFLRLARLPWLREGTMPRPLRERFVRQLGNADLRAVAGVVEAFLCGDPVAALDPRGPPPGGGRVLIHWLNTHRDTDLHDPILIDALSGRSAERLGVGKGWAGRTRSLARPLHGPAAWIAVALALIVMWLQPREILVPEFSPKPPAAVETPTQTGPDEENTATAAATTDEDMGAAASEAATGSDEATAEAPVAPDPSADTFSSSPRVYFQISSESQRTAARSVELALERYDLGDGIHPIVPGIELREVRTSGLRCFTDAECGRAGVLLDQINRRLVRPARLENLSSLYPATRNRENHFELWLAPDAFERPTDRSVPTQSPVPNEDPARIRAREPEDQPLAVPTPDPSVVEDATRPTSRTYPFFLAPGTAPNSGVIVEVAAYVRRIDAADVLIEAPDRRSVEIVRTALREAGVDSAIMRAATTGTPAKPALGTVGEPGGRIAITVSSPAIPAAIPPAS